MTPDTIPPPREYETPETVMTIVLMDGNFVATITEGNELQDFGNHTIYEEDF